jgi:hypothetical protein
MIPLEWIWAGMTNRDMARRLLISVRTVEAHRANMMKKLRVSNTTQLLKTTIQGKWEEKGPVGRKGARLLFGGMRERNVILEWIHE